MFHIHRLASFILFYNPFSLDAAFNMHRIIPKDNNYRYIRETGFRRVHIGEWSSATCSLHTFEWCTNETFQSEIWTAIQHTQVDINVSRNLTLLILEWASEWVKWRRRRHPNKLENSFWAVTCGRWFASSIDDSSDCGLVPSARTFLRDFQSSRSTCSNMIALKDKANQILALHKVLLRLRLRLVVFAVVGVFPVNGKRWQKKAAAVSFRSLFRHSSRILNEIFECFPFFLLVVVTKAAEEEEEEEEVELVAACCDVFSKKHEIHKRLSIGLSQSITSWSCAISNYRPTGASSRNVLNLKVFPLFRSHRIERKKFILSRCCRRVVSASDINTPINAMRQHKNDPKLISS